MVCQLAQLGAVLEEQLLLVAGCCAAAVAATTAIAIQAGFEVERGLNSPEGGDLAPLLAHTAQGKGV